MNDTSRDRQEQTLQAQASEVHWLVRPTTIRGIWIGSLVLLTLLVAAEWLVPIKARFPVDDWPAFGAVYGFVSCVAMVLLAKALGWFLKRPDDYYREPEDDA